MKIDGVIDIETAHWDEFVMGAILIDGPRGGDCRIFEWRREDEFIDLILSLEGTYWWHNGGCYDGLWFLEHLRRRDIHAKVSLAGSRIVCLEVGDLTFRDSFALIPFSLDEAAGIGTVKKEKTGLPCRCGVGCGGYCSITRDMPRRERLLLRQYLESDCRSLKSTLENLFDYAESNSIILAGTVGASSYKTASNELDIAPADWRIPGSGLSPTRAYAFARAGYGGGRTQCFRAQSDAGNRYDIVSAYPAALSTLDLPCGEPSYLGAASRDFGAGKEGIYEARVRVHHDTFIPPLPFRLKDRIAYPTGRFTGIWAANELRYAESTGDVTIEAIGAGLVWPEARPVFRDYCRRIWRLRDDAKRGGRPALAKWLKWLANSLTGKFAQRPEKQAIDLHPGDIRLCPANAACYGFLCSPQLGCCKHACYGTCGRHEFLDRAGQFVARRVFHLSPCAHVHWAAYLTAHTRGPMLHAQLTGDGRGGLSTVYCDTDSCFSEVERERTGDQLGDWNHEGRYRLFEAIAPKTYRFRTDGPGESITVARSKGIPDAARHFDDLLAGEAVVIDRGVSTFKAALQRGEGMFVRKRIERHALRRDFFGDRLLISEGITVPLPVGQLFRLADRDDPALIADAVRSVGGMVVDAKWCGREDFGDVVHESFHVDGGNGRAKLERPGHTRRQIALDEIPGFIERETVPFGQLGAHLRAPPDEVGWTAL